MDSHSQLIITTRTTPLNIELKSSALLQPPGEVRIRIYEYVFHDLPMKVTNIGRSNMISVSLPRLLAALLGQQQT